MRGSGKSDQGGNNLDKISIAENDDKDFEYFATREEPDPENEFKVRDWHVMLENDHQSHNETFENDDVNVKYNNINQDKKTPERRAARRRHQQKDVKHSNMTVPVVFCCAHRVNRTIPVNCIRMLFTEDFNLQKL